MAILPPVTTPKNDRELFSWLRVAHDLNVLFGTGTPETNVTAPIGTMYLRKDGGAGTTLYVKESGTGATGWAAK
jgi:hypothetical protein